MTHGGWLTPPVSVAAMREIRLEVKCDSSVPTSATKEAKVTIRSFADLTKVDVVKTQTKKG